jgi:serine/threonine protein kinase
MRTFCLYYRDVKTLNVFMSKSDLLKLGDFGISRVLESESKFAESVSLLIFQNRNVNKVVIQILHQCKQGSNTDNTSM